MPSNSEIHCEHEVRRDLETLLEAMPYEIWLNFELLPRHASGDQS